MGKPLASGREESMLRKDILMESDEEKEKLYCRIQTLFLTGKPATMKEHKSGFPSVTVDCEDIHILTDIISIEQKRKEVNTEQDHQRIR